MAGIGFELRKAISRGGIGTFLRAAFSGVMIVAGPWLFSIVGISLMQRVVGTLGQTDADQFLGVIVYTYAGSLVVFGGIHFLYTRMVADLLFQKQERRAAGTLVFFLVPVAVLSGAFAALGMEAAGISCDRPLMLRIATITLFAAVNGIWLIMVFISLLRWYGRILAAYAGGMAAAVVLVRLLSERFGLAGAVLGFAAGHLLIVVALLILAFGAYRPDGISAACKSFPSYLRRFPHLFATGFLYNWAIWVDKIIYWFLNGSPVSGSAVVLYPEYDVAVYFANLTMIPGLVYFITASETLFYVRLRKFLTSLSTGTFARIQQTKSAMISAMRHGIVYQSMFQSVFTAVLVFTAPALASLPVLRAAEVSTLQATLGAVFFHLLFLTLLNYNFYLELYSHALVSCALFLGLNAVIALLSATGVLPLPAGYSYLAGGIGAAAYGLIRVELSVRKIDRRILARASGL